MKVTELNLFLCSLAIVIGLLVMMWPVLTKVQYERLPELVLERKLWYQIALSLFLNWIIGKLHGLSSFPHSRPEHCGRVQDLS